MRCAWPAVDGLPKAQERADQARYQEVHVRSALVADQGMPFKWALNPYRGCTHACEYCYARKYQRHLELGAGDDFSSLIFVKSNLPEVLRRELARPALGARDRRGRHRDRSVPADRRPLQADPAMSRSAGRTPDAVLDRHQGPDGGARHRPAGRASRHAGCQVYLSVPSVDEHAWATLEPGTAPPRQRLRAVRAAVDAGVDAGVLMMPLVPGITTSRADRRADAASRSPTPASAVAGSGVTHLEDGVRQHFFAFLEREYPGSARGLRGLYKGRLRAEGIRRQGQSDGERD